MFPKTYKVTAKKMGKLAVEVQARDFKVILDEPKGSGGTNIGMNPVELLLCSLGGCQTITASAFAEQVGVTIDELWVDVEGDLDSAGMMGYTDYRPGYQKIRFNFHIKTSSSEEKVKKLIELVKKRCPVGDSLCNGVEFDEAKITIEK